ncbi:MAG: hypothetical protein QXU82_02395 [Candidatus Aenigmatarchaeota archaeon]
MTADTVPMHFRRFVGNRRVTLAYLQKAKQAAEGGNQTTARMYLSKAYQQYIRDGNLDLDWINAKVEDMERKYNIR